MDQENKVKKSKDHFFFDMESFRTIDTFRIIYLIAFVLSFAITEMGRYIYRPFIYQRNINDFGIADSMGNLGGIIVQIFFGLFLMNSSKIKGFRLIIFFVIGYIVYEIMQLFLPKGVFDWKDVYGSLIGGIIGLLLFLIIHRLTKKNKTMYRF